MWPVIYAFHRHNRVLNYYHYYYYVLKEWWNFFEQQFISDLSLYNYFLRPTFLASESKKKYFESEKKYFESKKKYF